jgi:hypothetical protein
MGNTALKRAGMLGTILQVALVVLGHFRPSLQTAGLFPIGGSAIGALAGFCYARWSPGVSVGRAMGGGAMAGAVGGFLGSTVSFLLKDVPPSTILVACGSTLVTGLLGGLVGRLLPARSAA